MSGAEAGLAAATIGSTLIGGILAGDGQEVSSFEGDPELDPGMNAAQLKRGMGDYLQLAIAEAGKPDNIDTNVAPLPNFGGGGLPMNISAPAMDPARRNPERRTFAPVDIPSDFGKDLLSGNAGPVGGSAPGDGGVNADDPPLGWPSPDDDLGGDNDPPHEPPQGSSAMTDPQSIDQAQGAIELLMQQLRGVGTNG